MSVALGIVICALAASGIQAADKEPAPDYVASRQVAIEYRTSATRDAAEADLWVTSDSGRTWQRAATRPAGEPLLFESPEDGNYGFFVVVRNEAGSSSEPPGPGTTPALHVIVDTTCPLLQIHKAEANLQPDGSTLITMQASLVEENLSDTGLRVFRRSTGGSWNDGGPLLREPGVLTWKLPASLGPPVELRVVATDLAGNSTTADIGSIEFPKPAATENPPPVNHAPPAGPGIAMRPVEPAVVTEVEPVQLVGIDPTPAQAATSQPADLKSPQPVADLRAAARRLMAQGQYGLAATRLEDAQRLDGNDAEISVELGSAWYRLGRYEDARRQFAAATEHFPDHVGAWQGRALVAATQKRYPEAREDIQRVLQLRPESGNDWLRYGDIEHRLGNLAAARTAWERAQQLTGDDARLKQDAQRRLDYFKADRTGSRP